MKDKHTILITSYLEEEYVEQIRKVDERIEVIYEPTLIAPPRYVADHNGSPTFKRTVEQEQRWRSLLKQADILFDFDHSHRDDLPELAPQVKWIQFTSSGIGAFVKKQKYAERLPNTIFTKASGIHAQPLAEYCMMVIFMFSNRLQHIQKLQKQKKWERFTKSDVKGSVLTVIGMGNVGRKVAEFGKAVGMKVIGIDKEAANMNIEELAVHELYPVDALMEVLRQTNYLVLIAPHTPETEHMIGYEQLMALPQGAVLINIARGSLVVEEALLHALNSGHLAGAGLDVFATEPLPADSPFWEMPNVLVSPHSASTSDKENQLLTDLFCENIRRYLAGENLINVLDPEKMY